MNVSMNAQSMLNERYKGVLRSMMKKFDALTASFSNGVVDLKRGLRDSQSQISNPVQRTLGVATGDTIGDN